MGAPVKVGDVLAEKYEVARILGQGGMGVVVAARHRELDKLVALKFMHEEVAASEPAIDRFLREAKAAARLQNEHVGRVLDVGRLHGGVPYIVMEYLEGRDLADVTADHGGVLPVSEVCEYMLQACEAMAEAHAAGIIHRDLKPQNLFLCTRPDGRPLIKVLDFGISKVLSSHGATATHQTMGTPAYMSPEQMRSAKSCDGRADIWSLGVILYQLLSGTLPFAGETLAETMIMVMTDPLRPIASLRAGLPPALIHTIEKCLEKDRERRFNNVAELAHELTPFAPERARAAMSLIERVMSAGVAPPVHATVDAQLSSVVPATRAASPPQTTLGTAAAQSLDTVPAPKGRARWKLALLAIAIIGVIVTTVMVVMNGGEPKQTAANVPDAQAVPAAPVDAQLATMSADAAMAVEFDAAPASSETATVVAKPEPPPSKKPDGKKPPKTAPVIGTGPRSGSGSSVATVEVPTSIEKQPPTEPTPKVGSDGSGTPTKLELPRKSRVNIPR